MKWRTTCWYSRPQNITPIFYCRFRPIIAKTLEKFTGLQLDLRMIAPDHGPVWRKDFREIVELYSRWTKQQRGEYAR